MERFFHRWLLVFALCGRAVIAEVASTPLSCLKGEQEYTPLVVIITTYNDEYSRWRRVFFDEELAFPGGADGTPLGWNSTLRFLGIVTGVGPRNAAISVTALGYDRRFDLAGAYWLLAGISGGDPAFASLGSAIWVSVLVDGDHAKYVDPRESPGDWPTGWVPFGRPRPYGLPEPSNEEAQDMVHVLSTDLVEWIFNETQRTALVDTDSLRLARGPYLGTPSASAPPSVLLGASLSTGAIWEGSLSAQWARNWTRYWTRAGATFAASACEDFAVASALAGLARAGRTRAPREALLVLRTVSNFVEPPAGVSAGAFMGGGSDADASGLSMPAVPDAGCEAAFRTGSVAAYALARRAVRELASSALVVAWV